MQLVVRHRAIQYMLLYIERLIHLNDSDPLHWSPVDRPWEALISCPAFFKRTKAARRYRPRRAVGTNPRTSQPLGRFESGSAGFEMLRWGGECLTGGLNW